MKSRIIQRAFFRRDPITCARELIGAELVWGRCAGTIVETNKALEQDPALVNRDPYGEGWMIKVKVKNAKELEGLLRADAYAKHIGE